MHLINVRLESVKGNAFINADDEETVYLSFDASPDMISILTELPTSFFELLSEKDIQLMWDTFKYDCTPNQF